METQDIDESLYEHYSFTADSGQQALRVDKFLMNRIENATRNKIQQAAKAGSVRVNDVVVKSNYKVKGEIRSRYCSLILHMKIYLLVRTFHLTLFMKTMR